jgi:hypothetical protein
VLGRAYQHEDGLADAQLRGIENRDPLADNPRRVQAPDPVPAGIRRQMDLFGNFRERQRSVDLKKVEDPKISGVEVLDGKISRTTVWNESRS